MSDAKVIDYGGPAFPGHGWQGPNDQVYWPEQGMTLRDYFAAKALQGMLADHEVFVKDWLEFAKKCYEAADAMIEARKETPNV